MIVALLLLACDCALPAEPLTPSVSSEAGFDVRGLRASLEPVTCVDGEVKLWADGARREYVAFWCAHGVCHDDYVGRYYCLRVDEFEAWRSACPNCDFVCEGPLATESGGCFGQADGWLLSSGDISVCYRSCDSDRRTAPDTGDSADTSS